MLDSQMMKDAIDIDFVSNTLKVFNEFYSNRLLQAVREGKISQDQMKLDLDDFSKIMAKCQEHYGSERKLSNK